MDRAEITVEQYRLFDASYDEKPFNDGQACPTCPAMGVAWLKAQSYCRWAGKRLPTELEWEAAARGKDNRNWPWGLVYQEGRANLHGEADGYAGPAPVGSFPSGASPHGLWDMAGNVWEWVVSPYGPRLTPEREGDLTPQVVKGGGWSSNAESSKISNRNAVRPDIRNPSIGFRCVWTEP